MTINGSTSSSNWTFKIVVEETSTSIENNTSNVRVRGYLGRPSGNGGYGYSGNYNWQVKIDNNSSYTRSGSNYQSEGAISGGGWSSQALFDTTITIPHNADGTKTINVVGSMSTGDFSPSSASASGNMTLTALHTPPDVGTATMTETNSVLTALSVPNTTIVRHLSIKTITLNGTPHDGATLKYRLRHLNSDYALPSSTTFQDSSAFTNVDYTTHDVAISNDGKAQLIQDIGDDLNGLTTDWVYVDIGGTTQKPNGIAYTKPTLERNSTTIKRKSGNGVNLTDNKAELNLVGTIYKVNDVIGNNNTITQIGYKIWERDSSEPSNYTTLTPTIDSNGNVSVSNVEISNIDFTKVYYYKFILKDYYNYSYTIEDSVPLGQPTWTEYKNRVDFLAATIGGVPIVESGNNTNGNYIKYYDGTMICYKSVTASVAMTTAWGNLYEGSIALGNWPEDFIATPNVQVTNGSGAGAMIESFTPAPTKTSAGTLYLARAGSRTADVTINVLAIGKWK